MQPSQYTIKKSLRAQRVSLSLSLEQGLVVTIPANLSPACIPGIIAEKKHWIERTTQRLQSLAIQDPALNAEMPDSICFPALEQTWILTYTPDTPGTVRFKEYPNQELHLYGTITDQGLVRQCLRLWLRQKAQSYLVPWLHKLAKEHGFCVNKVSIRLQRTRWASCSRNKNISLNATLLLLPPTMVQHILLHELCHTIHLNHAKAFWDLLTQHDQNCPHTTASIRAATALLPAWAKKPLSV